MNPLLSQRGPEEQRVSEFNLDLKKKGKKKQPKEPRKF